MVDGREVAPEFVERALRSELSEARTPQARASRQAQLDAFRQQGTVPSRQVLLLASRIQSRTRTERARRPPGSAAAEAVGTRQSVEARVAESERRRFTVTQRTPAIERPSSFPTPPVSRREQVTPTRAGLGEGGFTLRSRISRPAEEILRTPEESRALGEQVFRPRRELTGPFAPRPRPTAPETITGAFRQTFTTRAGARRAVSGGAEVILSPVRGAAKGSRLIGFFPAAFEARITRQRKREQEIVERAQRIARDPDVGAAAFVSGVGVAAVTPIGPAVLTTVGVGTGVLGAREFIRRPSPETFGAAVVLGAPTPAIVGRGVRRATITRTRTEVAPERVFDPAVLEGRQEFPTTRGPRESLRDFARPRFRRQPEPSVRVTEGAPPQQGVRVATATPFIFPRRTRVLPGERPDPGLFVTPAGRASPFFLRVAGQEAAPVSFSILPRVPTPRVVEIAVASVERQPRVALETQKASQRFVRSQAGTGRAFITRGSEIAFDPTLRRQGRRGTTELEATIPPETLIVRERGRGEFTRFRGEVIPVERFTTIIERPRVGRVGTRRVRDVRSVTERSSFDLSRVGTRRVSAIELAGSAALSRRPSGRRVGSQLIDVVRREPSRELGRTGVIREVPQRRQPVVRRPIAPAGPIGFRQPVGTSVSTVTGISRPSPLISRRDFFEPPTRQPRVPRLAFGFADGRPPRQLRVPRRTFFQSVEAVLGGQRAARAPTGVITGLEVRPVVTRFARQAGGTRLRVSPQRVGLGAQIGRSRQRIIARRFSDRPVRRRRRQRGTFTFI